MTDRLSGTSDGISRSDSDCLPRAETADACGADAIAGPLQAARAVAAFAWTNITQGDEDAFPKAELCVLAKTGLVAAPLPIDLGGVGLGHGKAGNPLLAHTLAIIGSGSLPLGRLYEGHVNAVKLLLSYGTNEQIQHFATVVRSGHFLAVWNTEGADGVRLSSDGGLSGRKIFASGAGQIVHPLITARTADGGLFMVIPTLKRDDADLSGWNSHGMRASASGAVCFDGISVGSLETIGVSDDFHRQPLFSGGAWRFAAVQLGGISKLFELARADLRKNSRHSDPFQKARMGTCALAVETARLWVMRAAQIVDDDAIPAENRIAYANFARLAVERAGLDVLELVHRSVGLSAFMRSHPIERLSRDLSTYLRQPNPDKALCDAADTVLASDVSVLDLYPWL